MSPVSLCVCLTKEAFGDVSVSSPGPPHCGGHAGPSLETPPRYVSVFVVTSMAMHLEADARERGQTGYCCAMRSSDSSRLRFLDLACAGSDLDWAGGGLADAANCGSTELGLDARPQHPRTAERLRGEVAISGTVGQVWQGP
jgi:hypothetical protein